MARKAFDERLLTHHPQGKRCFDACLANGWLPGNADILRLVRLWDDVAAGRCSDSELSPTRLRFARWLVAHGRIGEDINPSQPKTQEGQGSNPERR